MFDFNTFYYKKFTEKDKILILNNREKKELAQLIVGDDVNLRNILLSIWNLYIIVNSIYKEHDKVYINMDCDDFAYPLISKIVNNIENILINCQFKYFDSKLVFHMEFDYSKCSDILNLFKDNYYTLNKSVDAIYDMAHKVDEDIYFDAKVKDKEELNISVRSIKSKKNKFEERKFSKINYILENMDEVPEADYECSGEILKKTINYISLKRGIEVYEKHSILFGYNDPFELISKHPDEREKLAFYFSEGNLELKELLCSIWDKKIATIGCCSGHYYENDREVLNRAGKSYIGFLLNNFEAVVLANYILNLVEELQLKDINCNLSTIHSSGYIFLSLYISRKYCNNIFSIIKKYVNNITLDTKIPYNFLVGLITELHTHDNTDYVLSINPLDKLMLSINTSKLDFDETIPLNTAINKLKRDKNIEQGSYSCDTDTLSNFVRIKRKNKK